jgi:uncharacterized short protein YbdD (DUF466 family)
MPATDRDTPPSLWRRITRVAHAILGVPDYERYLAHCAIRHPDAPPMTQAEFIAARLNDRYNRPGNRCC